MIRAPLAVLGGDAEKNDFTECARINDLIIMKGSETPKNQAITILEGFSTVSEVLFGNSKGRVISGPAFTSPK